MQTGFRDGSGNFPVGAGSFLQCAETRQCIPCACRIQLFLKDKVKIIIKDNGSGFDVDRMENTISNGTHFGLMGMRERVELLEGGVEIQSSKEAGTKLTIIIPTNTDSKEET